MLGRLLDDIGRSAERAASNANEALFEPVIRLGVTGLSRAGKTVFITSLVANLLDRGRMNAFSANGRIVSALLRPQPDDLLPRFEYETHLAKMTGANPVWPQSTKSISQLRLSLKIVPNGLLGAMRNPRAIHIDIVDYPGEWVLDLPLLDMDFATWSETAIEAARTNGRASHAEGWLAQLEACDPSQDLDEELAQSLAQSFKTYLQNCREAGFSACAPGRFLMPGDLEGSPALTFCPLPNAKAGRASLYRQFERRFESYKSKIIKPFFRDHFARLDRQVVLIDALEAIHQGPAAIQDLKLAMRDILSCFRVGRNSWLSRLMGKRIDRIAFAATKADHLHHTQHPALTDFVSALLREASDAASYKGAQTRGFSLASLRSTTEKTIKHDGEELGCVQGRLLSTGKQVAMYPGELPTDPNQLLSPAQEGALEWLDGEYDVMRFSPAPDTLKPGSGPPHIRLDQVAEFLLGDRL